MSSPLQRDPVSYVKNLVYVLYFSRAGLLALAWRTTRKSDKARYTSKNDFMELRLEDTYIYPMSSDGIEY